MYITIRKNRRPRLPILNNLKKMENRIIRLLELTTPLEIYLLFRLA